MEEKKCKNKKCQRPLVEGYKHKYCESCRNEQVKHFKDAGKKVLGVVVLIGTIITAATNDKTNLNKK